MAAVLAIFSFAFLALLWSSLPVYVLVATPLLPVLLALLGAVLLFYRRTPVQREIVVGNFASRLFLRSRRLFLVYKLTTGAIDLAISYYIADFLFGSSDFVAFVIRTFWFAVSAVVVLCVVLNYFDLSLYFANPNAAHEIDCDSKLHHGAKHEWRKLIFWK